MPVSPMKAPLCIEKVLQRPNFVVRLWEWGKWFIFVCFDNSLKALCLHWLTHFNSQFFWLFVNFHPLFNNILINAYILFNVLVFWIKKHSLSWILFLAMLLLTRFRKDSLQSSSILDVPAMNLMFHIIFPLNVPSYIMTFSLDLFIILTNLFSSRLSSCLIPTRQITPLRSFFWKNQIGLVTRSLVARNVLFTKPIFFENNLICQHLFSFVFIILPASALSHLFNYSLLTREP